MGPRELGWRHELKGAGLCDESLCNVLGVEAALLASATKANNIDIIIGAAAVTGVRPLCESSDESSNVQD